MKNIIKKFTALAMILTLIFPNVVMAADDVPKVELKVTKEAKSVDDELKVKLSMSKDTVANADFTVTYDDEILELVDDGVEGVKDTLETFAADTTTLGKIKYTDLKNDGVVMTFKVKAEGETSISVKSTDAYIVERNDKASSDELSTMKADVKTGVKKVVKEEPKDTKDNKDSNNEAQKEVKKDTTKTEDKDTTKQETKGFFGQFFEKINNDWVLKVIFIAIIVILAILILLLIDFIISSRRRKKNEREDEDIKINRSEAYDESRDIARRRYQNESDIRRPRTGAQGVRRPLTEEERRARAERMRRMAQNGQVPRRRPMTEEQRRQMQARTRVRREESMNPERRQVKRPIRRDREE